MYTQIISSNRNVDSVEIVLKVEDGYSTYVFFSLQDAIRCFMGTKVDNTREAAFAAIKEFEK